MGEVLLQTVEVLSAVHFVLDMANAEGAIAAAGGGGVR